MANHQHPSGLWQPRARKPRRQSTGERIEEILEHARTRAASRDNDSHQQSQQQPPSPRTRLDSDVGSADEMTGIMSRGSGQSYQAMHTAASRTRPRRSPQPAPDRSRSASVSERRQNAEHTPSTQDRESSGNDDGSLSLWQKTLGQFRSLELENKGSVARDHLALERTFLAWLRTSLAFASIGIAVTQLFRLNISLTDPGDKNDNITLRRMGKPLGATFLGISIIILLLGFRRYFYGQEWILKGKFPASRGTIIIVALVALAIMLLSLVVVIVIHPKNDI